MPRMDAELSRKLRDRRSVVDLEGTQWVSCDEWLQELHAAGAVGKARASFQTLSSSGRLLGRTADALAAPSTEQGNRHGSAGSIDSELAQKLQLRRGVVDSEGSAWQRLPEAGPEARPRGHATVGAIGKDGNVEAADASNEILERHGIRTVQKMATWQQTSKSSPEQEACNVQESVEGGSMDSELVRKLQTRRGVVDSEGSAWQSLPLKAAGPVRSRAERRHTVDVGGLVPKESAAGPEKVHGSADSELVQKLTARRGVVDSEGNAWQKLPGVATTAEGADRGHEGREGEGGADDDSGAVTVAKCPRQQCMANSGRSLEPRTPAVAAARTGMLGELRPWEEVHRGATTWVCDVWLSGSGRQTGVGTLAAEPAVICVARDGEIFCFVPEHVPLESEEDFGDVGRLVASFTPASLLSLRRSAAAPDVLGFHIAEAAGAEVMNVEPQALYARFEGPEEATACVEAIARATVADLPIIQQALPQDMEAAMRGLAVPEEKEQEEKLIAGTKKDEGIVNWVTLGEEPSEGWSNGAVAAAPLWIEGDDTL